MMDFDEFKKFLGGETPPPGAGMLLQALWYDARGDWARAHEIVQSQKGKSSAAVHGYLHREEGDLANADYWYDRAGCARPQHSLKKEWKTLVETLLAKREN